MIGVILSGGESTRMGSDKGLLTFHSTSWTQNAVEKIKDLQIPVVVSINQKQIESYLPILSSQILIVDNDSLEVKGPLRGILSAHLKYTDDDLLILACDMLLMETSILKDLLNQYNQQTNFDAFVYTNDGEYEPLCGIYSAKGLSKIYYQYQTNQLSKYSMKYVLEQMNTGIFPCPDSQKKCFRNFNTQAETNEL